MNSTLCYKGIKSQIIPADNFTSVRRSGDILIRRRITPADIRTNPICVAMIVDKGNVVTFTINDAVVKDLNVSTKLTASRIENLFYLGGRSENRPPSAVVKTKN